MEISGIVKGALEWARAHGYQEGVKKSEEKVDTALYKYNCLLEEYNTLVKEHNDLKLQASLREEYSSEADNRHIRACDEYENEKKELAQLVADLEDECKDLRDWKRGLVKPKTETPKKWPVCLQQSDGHISYVGSMSYNQMEGTSWFYPSEIFEGASEQKKIDGMVDDFHLR